MYEPVYGVECWVCGTEPTVGVRDPERPNGIQHTRLCGPHFFQNDRTMVDSELWNDSVEDTE